MNHDVITIGASAGGVEVLLSLVSELPADLPASLFIALHSTPGFPSALPEILSERGPLRATHPVHDEPIARGHIYIAPPDNHLLLRPGFMEVVRGPRENGHRPAVDALFRTASWAYGPRVIGVVLSGYQDCGTAGLMSIKARGGVAVVQEPDSAAARDMPESAISRVDVDLVVDPRELPSVLTRLATSSIDTESPGLVTATTLDQLEGRAFGAPSEVVCPACHGVLTETRVGEFEHYRCHVGHAFSLSSLVREQGEEVERALWAAVRSLEEATALNKRLATSAPNLALRGRFSEKAATLARQTDIIRDVLLHGAPTTYPKPSST